MSAIKPECGEEFLRRALNRRQDVSVQRVGTFQSGMFEAVKMLSEDFGPEFARMFNCVYGAQVCECGHTRDYHEKHWPACKGFREARQ